MIEIEYYNEPPSIEPQLLKNNTDILIKNICSLADYYKIFDINSSYEEISKLELISQEIRSNYKDLVVISTGGAHLNPLSLCNFCSTNNDINIYFVNNTDPLFYQKLFSKLDFNNLALLVISNSGNTIEVNAILLMFIEQLKELNINFENRTYLITSENENCDLRVIGKHINAKFIPHNPSISGRFSGLTNVSLLPALIAGIDVRAYLAGAKSVIDQFIKGELYYKIISRSVSNIISSSKQIIVNLAYNLNLTGFLDYYCQILAESLGKDGKGYTPIRGIGPGDQHSMLQLYLGGPQDKIYNFISIKDCQQNFKTMKTRNSEIISDLDLNRLNDINCQATIDSLKFNNYYIRHIKLADNSPKTIGSLMAFSMIEVILIAQILKINPFDQPSVELIKNKVKQSLKADLNKGM